MVNFNSLNSLIEDIMLEVRNNNIAESENLSKATVEQWIIQYRTVLIKQDIDKGRTINPMYVQTINMLPFNFVLLNNETSFNDALALQYSASTNYNPGDKCIYLDKLYVAKIPTVAHAPIDTHGAPDTEHWLEDTTAIFILESNIQLPKMIDFHFKPAITKFADIYGNPIELVDENRALLGKWKRYSGKQPFAYLKNGKVRIVCDDKDKLDNFNYMYLSAIFENPLEDILGLSADDPYPIPANMLTTLKELIQTKEIDVVSLSDTDNDSSNDLTKTQLTARDYKKLSRGIK